MRQRSTLAEQAKRVNRAMNLLKKLQSSQKAIECMQGEYGISRPQAYRYVQEAGRLKKPVTVPEEKEMVVVKLPVSMVKRIQMLKMKKKASIVGIITEALGIYLKKNGI